ncbi:hypothetical protein EPI10_020303 [Gossypium australe]|uniref:Uncharacterized protein n=1 Tax=Gossypium australe TaxID=47621 RepID=A0A5B6WG55_9ROSI|nr:hypothetical protein EPI10_020303 [Gossypium australe]
MQKAFQQLKEAICQALWCGSWGSTLAARETSSLLQQGFGHQTSSPVHLRQRNVRSPSSSEDMASISGGKAFCN